MLKMLRCFSIYFVYGVPFLLLLLLLLPFILCDVVVLLVLLLVMPMLGAWCLVLVAGIHNLFIFVSRFSYFGAIRCIRWTFFLLNMCIIFAIVNHCVDPVNSW